MEEIVKQAIEEVGYQPPKYAFDLSVMMMPDQGMILTFSEKDVNLEELLNNPHLDALLGAFAKAAGEKIEAHKEAADEEAENQSAVETKTQKVEETAEKRGEQPTFAVFAFESIRDVCQYAEALPSALAPEYPSGRCSSAGRGSPQACAGAAGGRRCSAGR